MFRRVTVLLAAALPLILAGCPLGGTGFNSTTPGTNNPSTPAGGSGAGSGSGGGTTTSGGGSGSSNPGDSSIFASCTDPVQEDAWAQQVLDLVNAERTSRGLDPVTYNATLAAQARQYACEMIHYDFFAHDNPVTGSTLASRANDFGYNYQLIGENLAAGQRSPQEALEDWMNSPGHRANILEADFTELGVGIQQGGRYGIYWVQEFGRPQPQASGIQLGGGTPLEFIAAPQAAAAD